MIFINCTKCKKEFKIPGSAYNELSKAKKPFICADCDSKKLKVIKVKVAKKKDLKERNK